MGLPGASPRPAHPDRPRTHARFAAGFAARAAAVLAGLATACSGALAVVPSASAADANPATPGHFTGLGFDQCNAPTQGAMDVWWRESPYTAVGIYTSGDSRFCREQPNLTPDWVKRQLATGWKLLPITLGPQASCTTRDRYLKQVRINPSSSSNYAKARSQGTSEAKKAVAAAKKLGIVAGSGLWYDIEAFPMGNTACKESAMAFLSAWTIEVRAQKYISGVYSSAASGIKMLADYRSDSRFTLPSWVWIADWNGKADTNTTYIPSNLWSNHQRVHQYLGGHDETYGGVKINIDTNYLDLGKGSVTDKAASYCGGVDVDFKVYPRIQAGSTPVEQVKALQCLLSTNDFYSGKITGKYDAATIAAVNRLQTHRGQPVSGAFSKKNWVALLSLGDKQVIKLGSTGEPVRRVQRAINASKVTTVGITGVADAKTMNGIVALRKAQGLSYVRVGNDAFWKKLKAGIH